ncbi:MAG: hypothetical protein WCK57_00620 [Verrucomicrobiae bacterium]
MKTLALLLILATCMSAPAKTVKEVTDFYEGKLATIDMWTTQIQAKASAADKQAESAQAELAASQSELSKANDNLATLKENIKALDNYAKVQWQRAEDNYAMFQNEQKETAKFRHEAHVKSSVIDIVLGIVAIAVTVIAAMCSGQIVAWFSRIAPFTTPYGWAVEIAILVVVPLSTFGFLKGVLAIVESRL